MSKNGPLSLFRNVLPGDPEEPKASFEDVSLDVRWGRNIVYDLDGESVPLPGPIHITDYSNVAGERRKMRFIQVDFFFYTRAQNYKSKGPESRRFAQAMAWQGDNNIIHLLEPMSLLRDDPMLVDEADPMAGEDRHSVALDRLEDALREHAQRIHEKVLAEEERIHEINYGMDEPQDLIG